MYKQINDTKYEVNREGSVRNSKSNRILKPQKRGNYLKVTLCSNNVSKQVSVHRLVATAFCNRIDGLNVVDHIDKNKYNNNADNLRWCTSVDNSRNGVRLNNLPNYIYIDRYTNKKGVSKTLYSYRRNTKRLFSSIELEKVLIFKNKYEQNI